jgi:hypothetical protein
VDCDSLRASAHSLRLLASRACVVVRETRCVSRHHETASPFRTISSHERPAPFNPTLPVSAVGTHLVDWVLVSWLPLDVAAFFSVPGMMTPRRASRLTPFASRNSLRSFRASLASTGRGQTRCSLRSHRASWNSLRSFHASLTADAVRIVALTLFAPRFARTFPVRQQPSVVAVFAPCGLSRSSPLCRCARWRTS